MILTHAQAGFVPQAAAQKIDEEYTRLIRQNLQDPRITTELVDHLPASDTVPSPLKFFGRVVGTPGQLTYAKDIHRYYEALARSSPRARFWKIGTTEEGRDIVVLAIADEATIASLDSYRDRLGALTDPRRTTDAQARQLVESGKPIHYILSGMHSPETGGPEMLIELANGQFLSGRAIAIDERLGQGHVVMFAIRPFWRWQTQGTYTLGFNTIMNWNDLDAGR